MFFGSTLDPKKTLRGRPKIYSDSLIFSLGVLRNLLGFDTESHFLWEIRNLWRDIFPRVPSNSVFNSRLRELNRKMEIINFYNKLLEFYKELLETRVRIIDSQPVIFKKVSRANTINSRIYGMAVGYCPSTKEYYYGYKLHLLITEGGFPGRFMLSPASTHDNEMVMDMTYGLKDIQLLGDKGYIDQEDKERLKSLRNIDKITPYKKNMKKTLSEEEKELLKLRGQVERDFSALEVLNVKVCKAKSTSGTLTRLMTGIVSLVLIMISNWELDRNLSVAFCPHFT